MRSNINPNVVLRGTGSFVPPNVIDNDKLSTMVKGFDESRSGDFGTWVDQVTHIHERRFSGPDVRSSDLAREASLRALASAGLEAGDIDMVLYASFTPSQAIPGDHCVLAHELGMSSTPTLHIMAACAGSIYGLALAYGMIESGQCNNVLVVGTETASKALNFHDPITSILFGDGAGAVILGRGDGSNGAGTLKPDLSFLYSARNIHLGNSNIPIDVASFPDKEVRPGVELVEKSVVEMESGPNVLRTAVKNMAACAARCLGYESEALKARDPELLETLSNAWIVPHQANGRILDGLAKELKVPQERVMRTVYVFGNTSAASNLIALDHGIRHGNLSRELDEEGKVLSIKTHDDLRIQKGDLVLLPSIGGGYLMGCAGFRMG